MFVYISVTVCACFLSIAGCGNSSKLLSVERLSIHRHEKYKMPLNRNIPLKQETGDFGETFFFLFICLTEQEAERNM